MIYWITVSYLKEEEEESKAPCEATILCSQSSDSSSREHKPGVFGFGVGGISSRVFNTPVTFNLFPICTKETIWPGGEASYTVVQNK